MKAKDLLNALTSLVAHMGENADVGVLAGDPLTRLDIKTVTGQQNMSEGGNLLSNQIHLRAVPPKLDSWRELNDDERVEAGDEFRLPLLQEWSEIYPEMVGKTRLEINAETPGIPVRYAAFRRRE